jgi:hypothetical protein
MIAALNDDIEFPRENRVGDVIHRLQQQLQPLGMDIKLATDEYTGAQYYALVSNLVDPRHGKLDWFRSICIVAVWQR